MSSNFPKLYTSWHLLGGWRRNIPRAWKRWPITNWQIITRVPLVRKMHGDRGTTCLLKLHICSYLIYDRGQSPNAWFNPSCYHPPWQPPGICGFFISKMIFYFQNSPPLANKESQFPTPGEQHSQTIAHKHVINWNFTNVILWIHLQDTFFLPLATQSLIYRHMKYVWIIIIFRLPHCLENKEYCFCVCKESHIFILWTIFWTQLEI
jgi:hypothetical protein